MAEQEHIVYDALMLQSVVIEYGFDFPGTHLHSESVHSQ